MKTILVILVVAALAVGIIIYLIKKGKVADSDGDYIPDVVEDAVEDVKDFADDVKATAKEVKRRAKNAKKELDDVIDEARDVADALAGKITKSKLRGMTKKELLEHAQVDLDTKLDSSLSKSNLINHIYTIHHSK